MLGLARDGTGVTAEALSVIDDEAVVHLRMDLTTKAHESTLTTRDLLSQTGI